MRSCSVSVRLFNFILWSRTSSGAQRRCPCSSDSNLGSDGRCWEGDLMVSYFLVLNCCSVWRNLLAKSLKYRHVWSTKTMKPMCEPSSIHCCPHCQGECVPLWYKGWAALWNLSTNPEWTPGSCQELGKNKMEGPTLNHSDSEGVRLLRKSLTLPTVARVNPTWITFWGPAENFSAPRGAEPPGVGEGYAHVVCPRTGWEEQWLEWKEESKGSSQQGWAAEVPARAQP